MSNGYSNGAYTYLLFISIIFLEWNLKQLKLKLIILGFITNFEYLPG